MENTIQKAFAKGAVASFNTKSEEKCEETSPPTIKRQEIQNERRGGMANEEKLYDVTRPYMPANSFILYGRL